MYVIDGHGNKYYYYFRLYLLQVRKFEGKLPKIMAKLAKVGKITLKLMHIL